MKLGLIGLTGSGKTTLFNSLSATMDHQEKKSSTKPNIKVVAVPDLRLEKLAQIFKPKKKTAATIEFMDIAGLDPGGKGAGRQFLTHIRQVDALVCVIRCFDRWADSPLNDIETINLELIVSDLESVEKRLQSIQRQSRNTSVDLKQEAEILERIKANLEDDQPARTLGLNPEEAKIIKSMGLLTLKPVIYVANIAESDLEGSPDVNHLKEYAEQTNSELVIICAQIEEELARLSGEDREEFRKDLGIQESALDKLIRSSYRILGLISFLTAGTDEVRAWTIKEGSPAPAAASVIHSDIERGFIRAEAISYQDFIKAGSFAQAREMGLIRSEGKQYIVKDGDIIDFRFNV